MILITLKYVFYIALVYFFITKILKTYYVYYTYKSRGAASLGFPWPLLGNLALIFKVFQAATPKSKRSAMTEYYHHIHGEKLPKVIMDFRNPDGTLIINDPDMVQDLYGPKNKYFDKNERSKTLMYFLFGDSIILEQSNDLCAIKRKHLSAAFYKDKIQYMLKSIIEQTHDMVEGWKKNYAGKDQFFNINSDLQTLTTQCIQACIFGQQNLERTLKFSNNGLVEDLPAGKFVRQLFLQIFMRSFKLHRMIFKCYDNLFIGSSEKECRQNAINFREFIKMLIDERREQLKDPQFKHNGDFLSILLQDELFRDNENMMIDECVTFMIAATQTSTMLLSTMLYYITRYLPVRDQLFKEIKQTVKQREIQTMTTKEWEKALLGDDHNWSYLTHLMYESLRIEPPNKLSTYLVLTESQEIAGFQIDQGTEFQINMDYLHHNPEEWQEPYTFLPERWDPLSKYYLTPNGKKRHPASFGPFLGGKRICLGKTFAESIVKCIIPVICGNVEFEFVEKEFYEYKPQNVMMTEEPKIDVKVQLAKQM